MVKKPAKNPHQDTESLLLAAAMKVFAQKGYGGATVKEIAVEAGVNISLISYHFKGKEGLFCACLEKFGSERLAQAEKILTPPESIEDIRVKLKLWTRQFLLCHVENTDICSMIDRENIFEMDIVQDVFRNTFLRSFEAMVNFFSAAKKAKLIQINADPFTVATFFFGSVLHTGKSEQILKKIYKISLADEKYREKIVDQYVNFLLKGIT